MVGLVLMLLGAFLLAPTPLQSQDEPDLQTQADSLFQEMSTGQKIGQLFLVTFMGDRAPQNSEIAELILNYHVGGVVLTSSNDNLTGYGDPANAPRQVQELTSNLQQLALLGSSDQPIETSEEGQGTEEGTTSPTFEPRIAYPAPTSCPAIRHYLIIWPWVRHGNPTLPGV